MVTVSIQHDHSATTDCTCYLILKYCCTHYRIAERMGEQAPETERGCGVRTATPWLQEESSEEEPAGLPRETGEAVRSKGKSGHK